MVEPAAKRVKLMLPAGNEAEGFEVQVAESTERWSEFTLEDGTVLRLKMMIASFIRAENEFDGEGNPIYALKGAPQMNFVSVPDKFKRKGT